MNASPGHLGRITSDPMVCHGAPTVRGMRLRVEDALQLVASGMSHNEILQDYDELELEDMLSSLDHAQRHAPRPCSAEPEEFQPETTDSWMSGT